MWQARVLKEHADEYSETRYDLQVRSGQITLATYSADDREPRTWSVSARDLDPRLVQVLEPDSADIVYLQAVCSLYRDAVGSTAGHHRSVCARIPLAGPISDPADIVSNFCEFLASSGAKSPAILPAAIEDLTRPIHAALEGASGVTFSSLDGKTTYQQTAMLDHNKLLLIREVRRPRDILDDRYTFELLSTDNKVIDCRPVAEAPNLWDVTLPALERLETTLSETPPWGETRLWYFKLLFPRQAEAEAFASACAKSIPQLRERLYHANYSL